MNNRKETPKLVRPFLMAGILFIILLIYIKAKNATAQPTYFDNSSMNVTLEDREIIEREYSSKALIQYALVLVGADIKTYIRKCDEIECKEIPTHTAENKDIIDFLKKQHDINPAYFYYAVIICSSILCLICWFDTNFYVTNMLFSLFFVLFSLFLSTFFGYSYQAEGDFVQRFAIAYNITSIFNYLIIFLICMIFAGLFTFIKPYIGFAEESRAVRGFKPFKKAKKLKKVKKKPTESTEDLDFGLGAFEFEITSTKEPKRPKEQDKVIKFGEVSGTMEIEVDSQFELGQSKEISEVDIEVGSQSLEDMHGGELFLDLGKKESKKDLFLKSIQNTEARPKPKKDAKSKLDTFFKSLKNN